MGLASAHTCPTFDNFLNLPKYIKWEYLKGALWWWSEIIHVCSWHCTHPSVLEVLSKYWLILVTWHNWNLLLECNVTFLPCPFDSEIYPWTFSLFPLYLMLPLGLLTLVEFMGRYDKHSQTLHFIWKNVGGTTSLDTLKLTGD